jgi:hypothetical protein
MKNCNPLSGVLAMEAAPGSGPAGFFHRKADQAGFVVVSCCASGDSTGPWNNHNPAVDCSEAAGFSAQTTLSNE